MNILGYEVNPLAFARLIKTGSQRKFRPPATLCSRHHMAEKRRLSIQAGFKMWLHSGEEMLTHVLCKIFTGKILLLDAKPIDKFITDTDKSKVAR